MFVCICNAIRETDLRTAARISGPYSPTHEIDFRVLRGQDGGRVTFEAPSQ